MDNQYTHICPVSYFQFLFAKFQCSAGQYRSPSPLYTAPQKICCSHTPQKKKKKREKIDREASQTTSKSKCSQFKIEMGNTTCLEVAFAQLPSSSNAFRTFTDNSPELIDTVEISIYIYIHELMTETSSHPLSHGLLLCCLALENSEAIKTRHCGGFLVTNG